MALCLTAVIPREDCDKSSPSPWIHCPSLLWHPALRLWRRGIEASHQGIMSDGLLWFLESFHLQSRPLLVDCTFSLPVLLCLLPWCLMAKTEKKIFNMVPIRLPLSLTVMLTSCILSPCVHGFIIGMPSLNYGNQFCLLSVCARKLARQPFCVCNSSKSLLLELITTLWERLFGGL